MTAITPEMSLAEVVESRLLDDWHNRAAARTPGFTLAELSDGRVVLGYGALLIRTAYIGADLRVPEDKVTEELDDYTRELVQFGLSVEQYDGFLIIRGPS